MDAEALLLYSKNPTTRHYPDMIKFSPQAHILFLWASF